MQVKKAKTKENVYLRTGPDSTYVAMACIPKGTKVTCIGSLKINGKKWYAVKYKEDGEIIKGYTCAEYYKVLKKEYKTLADSHYTSVYVDNVEIGKATIEITGKGNYEGKFTKEFTIGPKEVRDLKVAKNTTKYIKLKFKADDKSDGYKLYRANKKNGKYKLVKTIKNKNKKVTVKETQENNTNEGLTKEYKATSGNLNKNIVIKDTKVKNGRAYYYKVSSFVKVNGSNISSPYSNVTKGTCKLKKLGKAKTTCNCYIRKKANANSKALKLASKKSTFKAIGISYDKQGRAWVKVKFKNAKGKYKKGYILKSLVKLK